MTNSERFVQAHKNTRNAVQENPSLNYRVQFGLELSQLYSKKEMNNYLQEHRNNQIKKLKVKFDSLNFTSIAVSTHKDADIVLNYHTDLQIDFEGTLKDYDENGKIEEAINNIYNSIKG